MTQQMDETDDLNITAWEKSAKRPSWQSVMSARWTEQQCRNATKKLKNDIFSFLPDLDNKKILDVGCGVGRFTEDLSKKAQEVYAVDFSPSMLSRAKKNLKRINIKFFNEAAHNLPFKDDFFDLTFEVTVFQHILNDNLFKKTLNELKRVTKTEGLIFLCGEMAKEEKVLLPYTIHRSLDKYIRVMKPWKLIKSKNHLCIIDNYTLTLWSL